MRSLTVLEPGLPQLFRTPEFEEVATKVGPLYESGDRAGAIDTFFSTICGEGYRAAFDRTLPNAHFERWVADADILFQEETSNMIKWTFTRKEAARVTQSLLNMVAANTWAPFREVYETVKAWVPQAENHELHDAGHAMLQMNPRGAAERIAQFTSSH